MDIINIINFPTFCTSFFACINQSCLYFQKFNNYSKIIDFLKIIRYNMVNDVSKFVKKEVLHV